MFDISSGHYHDFAAVILLEQLTYGRIMLLLWTTLNTALVMLNVDSSRIYNRGNHYGY